MLSIQLQERENGKLSDEEMQQMFNIPSGMNLQLPTASLCSTVSLVSPPNSDALHVSATSSPILCSTPPLFAKAIAHPCYGEQVFHLTTVCNMQSMCAQPYYNQSLINTQNVGNIPHLACDPTLNFLDSNANERIPKPPTLTRLSSMNHSSFDYLPISPMITEPVEHNDVYFQFSAEVESPGIMNSFVFNQNIEHDGNSHLFNF